MYYDRARALFETLDTPWDDTARDSWRDEVRIENALYRETKRLRAALAAYMASHDEGYRGGPEPLVCGCDLCLVARPILRPRAASPERSGGHP
jgi:hypothetical protein